VAHDHRLGAVVVVLRARSLYRFYRAGDEETVALRGVSLSVPARQVVAVTGPSGSGKSTLLACLAGIDEPDGGSVHIGEQRLSHRPERVRARLRADAIGVVFQSANLMPHLTLTANLALVRSLSRKRPAVTAAELLDSLGIAHRARAYPAELSGGELTRAGLAVALANEPDVLLADEPTGELDGATERQVLDLFTAVAQRGAAVVVASHSAAVCAAAHRVITLTDGAVQP
jgi:putative ABC transport system ATP-binding protein